MKMSESNQDAMYLAATERAVKQLKYTQQRNLQDSETLFCLGAMWMHKHTIKEKRKKIKKKRNKP